MSCMDSPCKPPLDADSCTQSGHRLQPCIRPVDGQTRLACPGHHESRQRGANQKRGLVRGPWTLSTSPRQRPFRLLMNAIASNAACVEGQIVLKHSVSAAGLRAPVTIEGSLIFPGRPDNARHLVGERHGSFVIAAAPFGFERPGAQPIQ
jgi:hypothetical protein